MIDYIKAYFPERDEILNLMRENYTLEKINYTRFDKKENEIISYETYKQNFENMELKITNKEAYIHNSIHHFYNRAVYGVDGNFNDFRHSNLVNSIDFLEDRIKLSSDKLYLSQGLEFGLNLKVPFDIDQFILHECILYDFSEVSKFPQPTEEQVYKEFEKGNYRLKIYNKGRQQCKNLESILRIEIKFLDKRDFNKKGIYVLSDLEKKDNLYFLYDKLFTLIKSKLMCVDNIEGGNFTNYKKTKLYKYCSPKFWAESNKDKFKLESRKVFPYFEKNKLLEHKKVLLTLMDSKFIELLES